MREISLSFEEDRLSSVSPLGQRLLRDWCRDRWRQQWKKQWKHKLVTWSHTHSYNTCTNTNASELLCYKIKLVTFCPHLEILWDMVAPLYLLSAWWATGPPGRAWSHRNEAPGCEEGSVADGWQALWLWSAEDRGVCWWNQLGEKWRLKGERWLGWHWRWRAWLEEWLSLGWWSEDLRRHKKDTEESVGRTSKRHLGKGCKASVRERPNLIKSYRREIKRVMDLHIWMYNISEVQLKLVWQ